MELKFENSVELEWKWNISQWNWNGIRIENSELFNNYCKPFILVKNKALLKEIQIGQ
jgi:hypothetical protein